ncbi:MAG: tRNA lysidine(34) synthetase TilS [Candidatus Cloacimonetes bacterium]|nr:tRNA lysidine(34) synthetase TilS [Candidatus Cloacimonadota bacterium]
MNFTEKFEKYVLEKKLISPGDKILIGFSGGADSTALLTALNSLRAKYKISILAAHLNYNLRGEDSIRDEEFVKNFCFSRNISLVIKSVTLDSHSDLENHAREIRFNYFHEVAKLYKINKIAVGHNKQDQAETIIFRLFRGSGYTGLKGILPIDGTLIHPLLIFSREEIVKFLESQDISWREDISNQENNYTRNKIRNQLIPWISENLNPNFIDKLSASANIFAETDEILSELSHRKYKQITKKTPDETIVLSLKKLISMKSHHNIGLFKQAFAELTGSEKNFYQNNYEEIESILHSEGSKQVMLPENIVAIKEYDFLRFCKKELLTNVDVNNLKTINSLRHRFTFENYRISMKQLKKLPTKRYLFEDKNTVYLDLDKTTFPMIIRHRQPGDRFTPYGMKNRKKLKDFFIDEKVPKFERDKVLIICDEDKILWVAGMRLDNNVAISDKTKNILKIKIEKVSNKSLRPAERIKQI